MVTAAQVVALHHAEPGLCAADLARRLRCSPAYVRATAQRRKLTLPRGKFGRKFKRSPIMGLEVTAHAHRLRATAVHDRSGVHWVDIKVFDRRGLGVKEETMTVFFDGTDAERKADAYARAINTVDDEFHGIADVLERRFGVTA